ncbi:zinc-finger homeodomain protein 1-like [Cucurbita moschata]|uniref:Zinc-finger homeodomain protein 1-like n=1 Tax=Cucurbita moschata TaxID=3662 RepID=A0A6J1HDE5_CUCMO|nr:zinc-finger homeodomain protein 1-like [Cucurbita moschata]
MDFEDQDDHDDDMEMAAAAAAASYDPLQGNSGGRVKTPTSTDPSGQRKPKYRECLKNHAVGIGGHALDGCGEFLAAGAEGTLDALKCAACNCHRNFHRKETDNLNATAVGVGLGIAEPFLLPHPSQFSPYYRTPTGYLHVAPHHRPLALPSTSGGGGGGTLSREEQEDMSNPSGGGGGSSSLGRKRFRTKFTQEQKDRMLGLAETLGWRIQKHDEALVQQFCNETGVKRHVLKVWMHNNKNTLGKKP